MNPQPSYSLQQAAELGGRAMLAWMDPQAGYLPITGYEQAHDVGRWWDAMLRLEHATGFSIPAHVEEAMLANLKRLTENPARLLVVDTPGGGEASINPHNLRETMLAYQALVRWRNNDWARQRGHQFLEALDRAIRPDGHLDVARLGIAGRVPEWNQNFVKEEENAAGWFDATQTTGRCLEAIVWFYEATGDELALRLADRLARLHLRMMVDEQGEARTEFFNATHFGHNHSYMGTLRGLFLFGRLTGQRHYIDAVTRIYRHSLWRRNISQDGWTCHDLGMTNSWSQNKFGKKQYESASPGDIAQLALWLALDDHQWDLLDDVERILRSNLLPGQITAADVGAPARKGDLTIKDNWIGGWGCPYDRDVKDLIYDVLSAVVHSLSDLYEHTLVKDQRGLSLLWHFDYEDGQVRVTHSRTDEAMVCIEPKTVGPIRIRIPAWTPADSLRVSVGGRVVHPPHLGSFIYLDGAQVQNRGPITLRYALPVRTTEEPCDKTVWHLTWRGDAVVASVPIRPEMTTPTRKNKPPVSMTLIPPSPVTEQIVLDIRVAVRNGGSAKQVYELSVYLDVEQPGAKLHHEQIEVAGGTAGGIKFRWATEGQVGHHTLLAVVTGGAEEQRTSQPIHILASTVRSSGRIDGAWAGIYHWSEGEGTYWNSDLKTLTEDQWRELVRGMHAIGMDIINIQELFRNEEYAGKHTMEVDGYQGRAFYPSSLYPGRMPIAAPDPVEAIFDEADKLGMHVLPGIGMYAWFDYTPASLAWHIKVADEIWERYGHHPSFYGWKISEEGHGSLGSRVWVAGANAETMAEDRRHVVDFFRQFTAHVRRLAPDKPVMVARSTHGMRGAEDTYRELLKHLDILCSFCFHRMPADDLTGAEAAVMLQSLCDEAGAHLWMNMEVFLFENGGDCGAPLIPRPIAGVKDDLLRYPDFEKVLCYQYPGLMTHPEASVRLGGDPAVKLYRDYQTYLKDENKVKIRL